MKNKEHCAKEALTSRGIRAPAVLSAALLTATALTANADVLQLNITGVVQGSSDQTGLFGNGSGANTVIGDNFSATYTYDTAAGNISSGSWGTLWSYSTGTGNVKVNGVTFSNGGNVWAESDLPAGNFGFGVVSTSGSFKWLDPAQSKYEQTDVSLVLNGGNTDNPTPLLLNLNNISTFSFLSDDFTVDMNNYQQTYLSNSGFDGEVTSFSLTDNGVVVSSVPLPGTAWLLLSGLGGMGLLTRKRRGDPLPALAAI